MKHTIEQIKQGAFNRKELGDKYAINEIKNRTVYRTFDLDDGCPADKDFIEITDIVKSDPVRIWYNTKEKATFTFVEGDIILVISKTEKDFLRELIEIGIFYGADDPSIAE